MKLDHATIITGNLEAARTFLCSVIGLSEGPRPPFGVGGHWLYANGKPAIHLIEAGTAPPARPASPRIDHVALRIETAQEWSALLERLRLSGLPYELGEVPLTGERQLFVAMAPGIVIELVTDQRPPAPRASPVPLSIQPGDQQPMKINPPLLALALSALIGNSAQSAEQLVQPTTLIADRSLSKSALESLTLAPRRYDTFWHTGDERLAKAALSPDFIDHTLPKGRKQGPDGPLMASKTFRAAVPDLTCEVEQMLVTGDRVTAFLHFRGHFTGTFGDRAGKGQTVDFIAVDIYRVQNGLIAEDWHLEDNLTLMQQLGIVAS